MSEMLKSDLRTSQNKENRTYCRRRIHKQAAYLYFTYNILCMVNVRGHHACKISHELHYVI
jgi:hypothetical protein